MIKLFLALKCTAKHEKEIKSFTAKYDKIKLKYF